MRSKNQRNQQRDQEVHQRQHEVEKTRKIQKILEEVKCTRNISSIKSVKKRILIPKVKNKEGEAVKTRQGIENVFAKFYEDLYEGEDGYTEEGMESCTEDDKTDPSQHNSIPEFTKNEIQDAIDRLKKGIAKDSNGIRAEQLKKTAVTIQKKKSGQSSMKLRSKRTSHLNAGERSVSRSFTKKVTGKIQATTGRFAACQFYTSCLPPFYMHALHLVCTEYNLQTRQASGLTTDV